MVDRRLTCCGALIAGVLAWLTSSTVPPTGEVLDASINRAFADSDGDLLPDSLERVLLLDPTRYDTTGDGVDDFLHAVQARRPDGSPVRAVDHELRVVCTVETGHYGPLGSGGPPGFWVHNLLRVLSHDSSELLSFEPFVDLGGLRVPLTRLVHQVPTRLVSRTHPDHGTYLLFSYRLADVGSLQSATLLPGTFGATVRIGNREITSGMLVQETVGVLTGLVPYDPDGMVLQRLAADGSDDPFWRANRVCRYQISVVGSAPGGVICEVTDTFCVVDPSRRLSCPPTCESAAGRVLFIPDGMRTIVGGGH